MKPDYTNPEFRLDNLLRNNEIDLPEFPGFYNRESLNEQKPDIDSLLNPKVIDFLTKNGFDLDKDSLEKLLARINDLISNETNNVLKIFD